MQKICPKCHKISDDGYLIISTKLLLGILLVGFGIFRLSAGLLSSTIPSLVLTITIIIVGYFYLKSYFFGGNRCPNCSNEEMIPVNSPEADEIAKEHKPDNGYKICSSCCSIIKFVQIKKQNKYWSLALFLVGLLGTATLLFTGIYSLAEFIDTIGFMICLGGGFYGLYTNLIITDNCEECGTKRSMIPLDTPKAHALIKEHNLTIPEEAQQQPASPKTSQ